MYLEYENMNQSMIGLSKILLKDSIKRETRGYLCYEIPEPVLIKIINPSDRYLNINRKGYNKILPFAETLSFMSGVNNLRLAGNYVKNLYNFSDDGEYMRAMYSPRIRCFTGISNDYKVDSPLTRNIYSGFDSVTDQLKYIIDSFSRDKNSRQCVIEIGDPSKDCFNLDGSLKVTKDYPCTRSLMFQIRNGKLDLTVTMRSNDHVFGAHNVNITNFSYFQEIVSNIINVPVGYYYHFANNYHYYPNQHDDIIFDISKLNPDDYKSEFGEWYYEDKIGDLRNFDYLINNLFSYEENLSKNTSDGVINFNNDLFDDWSKVFRKHWLKEEVKFENPYLNKLFNIK